MIIRSLCVAAFVPVAFLTLPTIGAGPESSCDECVEHSCGNTGVPMADEKAIEFFAEALFPTLPDGEQAKILAAQGLGAESYFAGMHEDIERFTGQSSATEWLEGSLGQIGDHSMTERQVEVLYSIANAVDTDVVVPALCFAPETSDDYVWMIDQMLFVPNPNAFQQANRWERTAISGPGLEQGDPTVITYSFVADGTFINDAGFGTGNSQLFAWLNSVYKTTADWQNLFAQVFQRWEDLTGTSYVLETNDDGAPLFSFFGEVGVRGDVRISAMVVDGNSGILAFNFFPDFGGDMVFDAFDSFYNGTGGNSLGLRNVIAHEHGHGVGMFHVCPRTQTKLMEPFVSFAFDGPQLDEVLNGQRHYGDPSEPSDSSVEAIDLGSLDLNESVGFDNVSLDDSDDVDFFKVSLTTPAIISFTVSPDAASYSQGPQTQSCNSGTTRDYNSRLDLQINVYNSDDLINPILNTDLGTFGESEEMEFPALEARDYYFEVFSFLDLDRIQLYRVDVSTDVLLSISAVAPTFVAPGVNNSFDVTLDPFGLSIEAGSERLFYRSAPGVYSSVLLELIEGFEYRATLPPFDCDPDAVIEFYIEATASGASFTLPLNGATNPFSAFIGEPSEFFSDSFQTDLGWSVTGSITEQNAGLWERAVPAGDGSRGDPAVDGDGSGACYLTGNGGPGSNTDVDSGDTILNSPLFDISGIDRPSVSYWRWYDNTGSGIGSGGGEDVFLIQVSDDGGESWYGLELIGPDSNQSVGGWIFVEKDLVISLAAFPEFDFATSQLQFRFIADDLNVPSVIEAGVDGVSVGELLCQDPPPASVEFSFPVALETVIPAGEEYSFDVLIDALNDTVVAESAMLSYILAGSKGSTLVPLVSNGGNSYTATFPAFDCFPPPQFGDPGFDVAFSIVAQGVLSGSVVFPSSEFLKLNVGDAISIFDDDFELDQGWVVSGSAKGAVNGMWERGLPQGDGSQGDPTADADGSGQCFVTGNLPGGAASDVDTQTILTSPVFDATGMTDPRLEFYHWYDNTGAGTGANPDEDFVTISISIDGSAFSPFDFIGFDTSESQGGWLMSELQLNPFFQKLSTVQVRFTVEDNGGDSTIEAAIDGVRVFGIECQDEVVCTADLAGNKDGSPDGLLDFRDIQAFLFLYSAGDLSVDIAGNVDGSPDGLLNFSDVVAFLDSYGAGCP